MYETDDRLDGDLVWEIFEPHAPALGPARRRFLRSAIFLGLIGVVWWLVPPLAVLIVCLAISRRDFRDGHRISRTRPEKAGASIRARFRYAWGAWKIGWTAIGFLFLCLLAHREGKEPPSALIAILPLAAVGLTASAILTAWAVGSAYWTRPRLRLAEGDLDRAWILLLGMILVGFSYGVILPICVWVDSRFPGFQLGPVQPRPWTPPLFAVCVLLIPGGLLWARELIAIRIFDLDPGKPGLHEPAVGKPAANPSEWITDSEEQRVA